MIATARNPTSCVRVCDGGVGRLVGSGRFGLDVVVWTVLR